MIEKNPKLIDFLAQNAKFGVLEFEPEKLKLLLSPCVYLIFDRLNRLDYIGMSERGIKRVLDEGHNATNWQDLRSGGHLILIPVKNKKVALELERKMLSEFPTRLNIAGTKFAKLKQKCSGSKKKIMEILADLLGINVSTARRYCLNNS